jgi:hypothetical protein
MSEQARPLHRSEVHDLRMILWLLISGSKVRVLVRPPINTGEHWCF